MAGWLDPLLFYSVCCSLHGHVSYAASQFILTNSSIVKNIFLNMPWRRLETSCSFPKKKNLPVLRRPLFIIHIACIMFINRIRKKRTNELTVRISLFGVKKVSYLSLFFRSLGECLLYCRMHIAISTGPEKQIHPYSMILYIRAINGAESNE